MVRLVSILSLLCLAYSGTSQVLDTTFNGYLSPFVTTSGSAPTWVTTGRFINENKSFTGAELSKDSKIIVESGGKCYTLTINTITATSPNIVTTVTDSSGTLTTLPRDAIIARPDSNGIYPYVAGAPDRLQSCIQTSNWLRTTGAIGISGTYNVTDTTITATSYTATLSNQEERILSDITSIGNNATITLPDPTSHLGKKVSVKQINPTGGFATQVTVNAIGNRIRLPGQTTLTNVVNIPAGTENEYVLSPVYDDNSDVYIWSVTEPNAVYSEDDGMKFYDVNTSSKQKVKVDYEVSTISEILSLNCPDNTLIYATGHTSDLDGGRPEYLVQSDSIAGYTTDSIAVIPTANSKYAILQSRDNKRIYASDFGIFPNSSVIDSAVVQKFYSYAAVTGSSAFYDKPGAYQLPEQHYYDINDYSITIEGLGRNVNWLSTDTSRYFRFTEYVDLSQPAPVDLEGNIKNWYYIADVVPKDTADFDDDWDALKGVAVLDTFIYMSSSGTPSLVPRDSAVANGYIAPIFSDEADPGVDGLYVVKAKFIWGGGYGHSTTTFGGGSLYVISGSIVERSGGTWTQYNPGVHIDCNESITIRNIGFKNFAPFVFLPSGTKQDKKGIFINNVHASHIARFAAHQSTGGGSGVLYSVELNNVCGNCGVFSGFSFKELEIKDCKFDNVLSAILWGTPYTKDTRIVDNDVSYSGLAIGHFIIQPNDSEGWRVAGGSIECLNNTISHCRAYNAEYEQQQYIFRTNHNTRFVKNRMYKNSIDHIYVNGNGNTLTENKIYPYNYPTTVSTPFKVFHLKGASQGSPDIIQNNEVLGGITYTAIDLQKRAGAEISKNKLHSATGVNILESSSGVLNEYRSYEIIDTSNFDVLLATQNYSRYTEDTIAVGDVYYFDYRNKAWTEFPTSYVTPALITQTTTVKKYGDLIIDNCDLSSRYLLASSSPTDTVFRTVISNNIIRGTNALFLNSTGIAFFDVEILNNPLIELLGDGRIEGSNSVRIIGNNFLKGHKGRLIVESDTTGLITIERNKFSGWKSYLSFADVGLSNATYADVISIPQGNLEVNNNVIELENGRFTALSYEGHGSSLEFKHNIFKLTPRNSIYNNRIGVSLDHTNTDVSVDFTNNTYVFPDDLGGTRSAVEISNDIRRLHTGNNQASDYFPDFNFEEIGIVTIDTLLLGNDQMGNVILSNGLPVGGAAVNTVINGVASVGYSIGGSGTQNTIYFGDNDNTGIHAPSSSQITFSVSGSRVLSLVGSSYIRADIPIRVNTAGTQANPSLYWLTNTSTGLYQIAADSLGLSVSGTTRIRIGDNLSLFPDNLFLNLTSFEADSSIHNALTVDPVTKKIKLTNIRANVVATVNTNTTLTSLNVLVPVDVSSGAVEIDLPSGTPNSGDYLIVTEVNGDASANNITIDLITAGDNYHSTSNNRVINLDNEYVKLTYINSSIGWIEEN